VSAEIVEAGHFLGKSDASGAVDATGHVGDNQRSDVFVLSCSFEFVVSGGIVAVVKRVVLEIALAALIADGTV